MTQFLENLEMYGNIAGNAFIICPVTISVFVGICSIPRLDGERRARELCIQG